MDHTDMPRTNWAGNLHYGTSSLYTPRDTQELQELVRTSPKLKALGTRHSFNAIADSDAAQVSLAAFQGVEIDAAGRTVTVGAGVPYGVVAPRLHRAGWALHNLASLPHIGIAGATATATHGSGVKNRNLATAVRGLEMVTGTGEVLRLSRAADAESFRFACVHLGALGIVTRLTLAVESTFDIAQSVYEDLPFEVLRDHFAGVMSAGYSVSLFLDWQGHRVAQVWVKRRIGVDTAPGDAPAPELFGAHLQRTKLHPLPGHEAINCTEQMGAPGPWHERLPHFRMEFTPSSGEELQSEFFVPREQAYDALLAVERLRDRITPLLFVSEVRAVAADDLPMSMNFERDSIGIHFTWRPRQAEVLELLPEIEAALEPFGARPHWGKVFTMAPAAIARQYTHLPAFVALANRLDPEAKFRNRYLDSLFSAV